MTQPWHRGSIAMIDALGFKGIWKKHDPRAVLDLLLQMETSTPRVLEQIREVFQAVSGTSGPERLPRPEVRTMFISDTIVFAIWAPDLLAQPSQQQPKLLALMTHGVVCAIATALGSAAVGKIPLNYRGAIASGEFLVERGFLVGPAVDEAAELHERADGPFVELSETAAAEFSQFTWGADALLNAGTIVKYGVPRKGGKREERLVVSPFGTLGRRQQLHDVLDGMKRAFGEQGRTDCAAKYSNMLAFVEVARAAWEAGKSEREHSI